MTERAKTTAESAALDPQRIPAHIAVIMDGNGRWAEERMRGRSDGHAEGVNSVHEVTQAASDLGVKDLTLYAFSTENWRRPLPEVDTLMHLIGWAIRKETPELKANNVHIRLLGDIAKLPAGVRADLAHGVEETASCTGMNLNLCLSYSSRWEIAEAVRRIAAEAAAGTLDPASVTEETVASHLATAGIPDPDLLIRTGGEQRLSNFLLWQTAYSELYFTPVLWPDFGTSDLVEAVAAYQTRERRFGMTGAQARGETGSADKVSPGATDPADAE